MNQPLRLNPAASQRLPLLISSIGFAFWQLQDMENAARGYLVVRWAPKRGLGHDVELAISQKVDKMPFGGVIADLRKRGAISESLANDLEAAKAERNWLVHHSRRETRGILSREPALVALIHRLDAMAQESLRLHKALALELERFAVQSGVSQGSIDRESLRLAKSWGFE